METATHVKMTNYMLKHNYTIEYYKTYSQDPVWVRLYKQLVKELTAE